MTADKNLIERQQVREQLARDILERKGVFRTEPHLWPLALEDAPWPATPARLAAAYLVLLARAGAAGVPARARHRERRTDPMKVYLAARYGRREELKEYTARGNSVGVSNTGTWIYQTGPDVDANTPGAAQARLAQMDYDAIWQAEVVVLFTDADPLAEASRGGMHVEFGIALALRKRLAVVGPPVNLFHHFGGVRHFATWAECLEWLRPRSEYQQEGFFESINREDNR